MVARGGIEPPTRGFSGCRFALALTGRVHEGKIIQGVPRKQADNGRSAAKLRTVALVQNLVQTTPVSPRRRMNSRSLYSESHTGTRSGWWTRRSINMTSRNIAV